jgi:CheY-like chemotaxis protein/nitrogen-specific signal transduction histidine kinase
MAGTHLDITHRKAAEAARIELERKLQQTHKRESLNLMAGGIAHHFNNLLTAVLSNIEVAKSSMTLNVAADQALQGAENAAKRAADMSRLLRTYVGQGRRQKTVVDIGEHVRELVPLIRSSMPQNVKLETHVPSKSFPIEADPGEIHQVVMNLATNAWEAVGESDGVIRLSVYAKLFDEALLKRNVTGSSLRAGEYVCLKVTDTGEGMTEETTGRIFDPFFSTKFAGRGLGLAVTQGIVQGCRGGIFTSSQAGRGSRIEILFPAVEKPVELDEQETVTGADKGRTEGAVLLVDDEEMLLSAVSAMLRCLGFEVITATSGQKAIEVFQQRRSSIRCVLLDLTMPDMDGWQTLDALRKIEPGVCAILSTGYDVVELQEESRDVQPDGWVQKPYQLPQLQQELERCLHREKLRC